MNAPGWRQWAAHLLERAHLRSPGNPDHRPEPQLSHRARLDNHAARLDRQRRRIERLEKRLTDIGPVVAQLRATYSVIEHQIAALEVRIGELAVSMEAAAAGPLADTPESRDVLHEIQTEHARIRSRFQIMSAYEERIRRLESVVANGTARAGKR